MLKHVARLNITTALLTSSRKFALYSPPFFRKMATETNAWKHVSNSSVPPFNIYSKPIQKSQQDDREYRIIKLENGLTATLIHDANADKAAASLDVAVGHLYDPDDMPGLAHFCEHLLFMGTEQYPKENEYSEYLAKHNGSSNAYTSTSNTNYHFTVGTPSLEGALDRFSGFFHSPLFAPSCTIRELNAVDSEHQKNHQADLWRIFQINKHLTKEGHPWSKFGSGNKDSLLKAARNLKAKGKLADGAPKSVANGTLSPSPVPSRISSPAPSVASTSSEQELDGGVVGRETRRRLLEWWGDEYCASRMNLCVLGQEPLDELSVMVSKYFSPIKNRGRDPLPMIPDHPFGPNEKGSFVSVQTIMSFHCLEISFPANYQPPFWKFKPINFVSHFLGHEGPGSLHSYLKNKGWITALSSGPQSLARGFSMFKATMYLTESGFRHYRDVIMATFRYLSLLRSSQFEPFHQREVSTISKTRFRFAEKRQAEAYSTWVAEHMSWPVPEDMVLSAPQMTWEWQSGEEEKKIREYLNSFTLANGRVVLMAQKEEHAKVMPNGLDAVEWKEEPWYGTKFSVERFSEEYLQETGKPNNIPELSLPGPNEFIPTNLEVDKKLVAEHAKRPHLIKETPMTALWHKKDDRFWVPKASASIDIRSPHTKSTPKNAAMTSLFADLVNDSLTEYAYDADLAGLSYNFSAITTGFFLTMNGYNDKLPVLAKHILDKVRRLVIDPDRLNVMKEQAKRDWENFFLGQSYGLADYYCRYLMTEMQWTQEEKLAILPEITPEDVQAHAKTLLSEVQLRILVTGNVYKDEAIKFAEVAEQGFGQTDLPSTKLEDDILLLPPGSNFIYSAPIRNPNQPNSAISYFVPFGSITDQKLRVTASLLAQILSEPAFNVLRTQEQLGYIVFCSSWSPGSARKGLRIVVQSERYPDYLEERVEEFLKSMETHIDEMSEEVFAEQKAGLKRKWLESDKNLSNEAGRFMSMISNGQLDFLRDENDSTFLAVISKKDILDLFMSNVHPSSKTRSKLSVHMKSQKQKPSKIHPDAASAFEDLVQKAALPGVDASAWRDAVSSTEEPIDVNEFGKYWVGVLGDKEGGKSLLHAIPDLMAKFPIAEKAEESRPREGVVYISDMKEFRSRLEVAPQPGAMVQWGDLPVSKY